MLFIFGIKSVRIARFINVNHICYPCKAYDREISVFRSYFHFCLIPVFPVGPRQFKIRCRNCGDETSSENLIKEYEKRASTPFYFYSAWLVFASLGLLWFYWNQNNHKHNMVLIRNPIVGDVYTIKQKKNDETSYYFLKIISVRRDTIFTFHSSLDYGDFVNRFASDDYFMKNDTLIFSKKMIQDMWDNDEIFDVARNYGEGTGFYRIH